MNGVCNSCGFEKAKANMVNALPNGHRLNKGRYRITRCIGSGGYGITYEALDIQLGRVVALKEFFPVFLVKRDPNGIDAVCMEGKSVKELEHTKFRFVEETRLLLLLNGVKEIVKVHHSFEENHTVYYAMELLEGMDMQRYMQKNGCFTWQMLSPILIQVMRALHVLHQAGYIHRDVTPDNIFLLPNQEARLIDFGNARRYNSNQELTAVVKDKFAPEEQYSRKGNQGPWTDIFSLCVTIHYALTGHFPQKETQNGAETNLLQLMNLVPPNVGKAIRIGLASDINRRYRSIADFAYALYPGQMVLKGAQLPVKPGMQITAPAMNNTVPVKPGPITAAKTNPNQGAVSGPVLICVQGAQCGHRWTLQTGVVYGIGRGSGKTIQYPDGVSGISRNQCSILWNAQKGVYIRDDGSSFGTFVDGQRLVSGQWKQIRNKDIITFGKEIYVLSLVTKK